jgi:hypothetical protein
MLWHMRTTLHLDPDVAALLQRARRQRKAKLRTIVNEALRESLGRRTDRPEGRVPYVTEGMDLGPCLIGGIDDVAEALALAEGEAFR